MDSRRAELVERARLEIDRQLKELGLDPQLTTNSLTTTATRRTGEGFGGALLHGLEGADGVDAVEDGVDRNSCTSSAKAMVATAAIT